MLLLMLNLLNYSAYLSKKVQKNRLNNSLDIFDYLVELIGV